MRAREWVCVVEGGAALPQLAAERACAAKLDAHPPPPPPTLPHPIPLNRTRCVPTRQPPRRRQ